jgi:hypothetical protein
MSRRSVDKRKARREKQSRKWAETKAPRRGQADTAQMEQSVSFVLDTAPTKARCQDEF